MAIIIPIIADARGLITGTVAAERGLTRLGRNTQKLGRSMTRNLTLPLVVLGAAAVKGFADFDKAITESTSIMGDVSEETRDRMTKAARDVATTLGISHKDAAQSYFFLASAGLNAEQSIAALPQVAAFAKAGMFDMATATDLATDAQSALGLSSKNAEKNLANLTRVTDVFVKANTMANASVEQFATSITTKAGVALRNLGIPLEEGVAVLSVFADQGIKGEKAGTLLTRTLQGLEEQSRKNTKQFEAAGISVFDARGNFRNLADITADLTKATKGMTVEQKSAFIAQLGFNKLAREGVLALLGNEKAVRKYEAGLKDASGFTGTVAAKQLETFSEQVNLMKAQLLDVGIDVAPIILNDFLNPLVNVIKNATAAFKGLSPETQKLITRGLLIAAALGPVLIILGKLIIVTGTLIGAVKALRLAVIGLNTAFLFSPIGLIVIAVVALAAALFIAYQRSETFRNIVNQVAGVLRNALGVAVEFVKRKLEEWGPAFNAALNRIRPVLTLIGRGIQLYVVTYLRIVAALVRTWITVFKAVGTVIGPIVIQIGRGIATYIVANVRLVIRVVELAAEAFNRLRDTVISVVDRISGPIDRVGKLVQKIPGVDARSAPAGGFFFRFSKDAKKNIRDAIASATQEARKNLASLGGQLGGLVSELIGARSPEAAEAKAIRDRLKREERARDESRLRAAVSAAETVQDRIDAQRELDDWLAEREAERLEESVAASQSSAQKQIDDLVAEFNRGAISAEDFQARLAGIIGAGPGAEMGAAFVDAFSRAFDSLITQIKELVGMAGGISADLGVSPAGAGAEQARAEREKAFEAAQKRYKDLEAKRKQRDAQSKIADNTKKSAAERAAAAKKRDNLQKEINSLKKQLPAKGSRAPIRKDFGLAQGGILKQTVFAAGEAGPEAIIPLGSRGGAKILRDAFFGNGMGANGSGGSTYNITVNAGLGTNPDELSRVIVESIKRYERRNGQVFQGPLTTVTGSAQGVLSTDSGATDFNRLVTARRG